MFKRLLSAALVFGSAALAPPAFAGSPTDTVQANFGRQTCGPRQQITANLQKKFGETKQAVGLANQSQAFELWSSEKTGSWTMLMTNANGISCIVASGKSWHTAIPVVAGDAI